MSTLEIDVGIICACMPTMPLLLRRVAPRLFGSTLSADSYIHPRTSSHSRNYCDSNSHHMQSKNDITKTTTTTVTDMPKESDSTIELVEDLGNSSMKGGTIHPISTKEPHNPQW